jgi:hypothetical protein
VAFATRVEVCCAIRAATSALHVFINAQYVFALTAHHSTLVTLRERPCRRLMFLKSVVAAYTCVELEAARVADRDDVAGRVPVCALGQRCDRYAIDLT